MDRDDQFADVYQFNSEVIGIERKTMSTLSDKEFDWLVCALREETRELIDAGEVKDHARSIAGQIDALIDIIYFAIGGLTRLGVSLPDAKAMFHAVHSANMSKVKGAKKGREIQTDLDAAKPEGWVSPDEFILRIVSENITNESNP